MWNIIKMTRLDYVPQDTIQRKQEHVMIKQFGQQRSDKRMHRLRTAHEDNSVWSNSSIKTTNVLTSVQWSQEQSR